MALAALLWNYSAPWLGAQSLGPALPIQSAQSAKKAPEKRVFTEAERVTRIQALLSRERAQHRETQQQLEDLEEQFNQASEEFRRVDEQLIAERARLKTLIADPEAAQAARNGIEQLEKEWTLSRTHFDSIISRRKIARQQLETLNEKILLGEEILEFLTVGDTHAEKRKVAPGKQERTAEDADSSPAPADSTEKSESDTVSILGLDLQRSEAEPQPAEEKADEKSKDPDVLVLDERVSESRRTLNEREEALGSARRELDLLDRSLELFQRDLTNSEKLLAASRESAELATATVAQLDREIAATDSGKSPDKLAELRSRRDASQAELEEIRPQIEKQSARVLELRALLEQLRASRAEVASRVGQADDSVREAQQYVWFLESPFAPHRFISWLTNTGPKIVGVLVLMFLAWWIAKAVSLKVITGLIRRSRHGTIDSRKMRAETMRRVFQSTADVAIVVLGLLAILEIAGMDVTVLLGGAAVIGAAVAFGSQNLIKDYFSGFMMLLENQYSVGDVIKLAGVSGVVEDISLRMTVLRDEEGVVHFIPHSQVTTVSNMTHGWSRAVFNVNVAYEEDVSRVINVLIELARQLRADPVYGSHLIGEPEMLGVDSLGASGVVIKFLIKTQPTKQWGIKRVMLRRIKEKFDELGIEIALPHQVVYQRQTNGKVVSSDSRQSTPDR